MLTENEIRNRIQSGDIIIQPFREEQLGPNSYDVRLGNKLMRYTNGILDPMEENPVEEFEIPEEGMILWPGVLYLGHTEEYTETRNLIPMYEGRSSLARLGFGSHITAGFGDIGFKGRWTLEITVNRAIRVYPGMRVGQLYYHLPDGEVTKEYNGKYQGSEDVTASRLYKDWED